MSLGYRQLYSNGINNNSQLTRSVDMGYQRGATFSVTLTGDTYISSMELVVDLYVENERVGRMSIVPHSVSQLSSIYYYEFNIRPYNYLTNFIKAEHHKYTYKNDWFKTNTDININNTYKNIIKYNIKYGYRYKSGNRTFVEQIGLPKNNFNHYTMIPICEDATSYDASDFTNTGYYFNLIGGVFQMDDKYYLPNFNQQISTAIGTGSTLNILDTNRILSPISQYLMDFPTVPEQSEQARFLTESPRIQTIQSNESHTLYYLNGITGDRQYTETEFVLIETFDETNTKIDTIYEQLNFSGTTYESPAIYTTNLTINALPIGPVDINNLYSTVDWSDVYYYKVQLFTSYPTYSNKRDYPECPVSEIFYFYVKENCLPQSTRLCWLNSKGGYDYYTFQSYRNDTKKIDRKTFDNRYYSTNLSSPDRDFGRTVKTFDQKIEREIILESDYLSLSYGNWLEELFESPQVYEVKPDFISPIDRQDKIYKDLKPVQILSTEVEKITKKHRKLNKYRITLQYANTYFTNNGF